MATTPTNDGASAGVLTPAGMLRAAVKAVPSMRYALGVGGIASVVAIVLLVWKLEPQDAIFGSLIVLVFMVALVVFAALVGMAAAALKPLALFFAWALTALTVGVAILFVSCAFFDRPKTLPCLLRGECGPKPLPESKHIAVSTSSTVMPQTATALPAQILPPPPSTTPSESVVEKTYHFDGPFRIARDDNSVNFILTEAKSDDTLANSRVTVEEATLTATITSESDEPFAFDAELLVFGEPFHAKARMPAGTDFSQLIGLQSGYASDRRVFQLTIRTDADRALHSLTPLSVTVDASDGSASAGELKKLKLLPVRAGDDGVKVQVFLWTLWGGQHYVELTGVEIRTKLRVIRAA